MLLKIILIPVAVFALGAMTAPSAFAEGEWLANGKMIAAELPVEITGLMFKDILVLGLLIINLHCEFVLNGAVGPGAAGLIEKVLNTSLEEIGAPLIGLALLCEVVTSATEACGKVGELAEVWLENLPWATKIELSGTEFLDAFPTTAAYEALCPNAEDYLCEGLFAAVLTNVANGVLAVFKENEYEFPCTTGTGHIGGEAVITLTNGEILSVS
jgi:hypothetical protein